MTESRRQRGKPESTMLISEGHLGSAQVVGMHGNRVPLTWWADALGELIIKE